MNATNNGKGGEALEKYKDRKHKPHIKFKMFLIANGITQREIAKLIDITEATVSLKINGWLHFTFEEVEKICNKYGIPPEIFLTRELNVSNKYNMHKECI